MKLSEILQLWKVDSKIDEISLDKHSVETPQLHSKYLTMLMAEKRTMGHLQKNKKRLKKVLREYYKGNLLQEEVKEMGREPFLQKIMNSDIPHWIDSDDDMIEINDNIYNAELKIEALQSILDQLNRRSFHINNAIKWNEMIGGGS